MDASPGELLRQALRESGLTPNQLALAMGVTSSCVWYLLHDERRITPNMARRIAANLPGRSAEEWILIQAKRDLGKRERQEVATNGT